jgi:hypothetical protein
MKATIAVLVALLGFAALVAWAGNRVQQRQKSPSTVLLVAPLAPHRADPSARVRSASRATLGTHMPAWTLRDWSGSSALCACVQPSPRA